jgi:cytochrome c oxidase subunit 4
MSTTVEDAAEQATDSHAHDSEHEHPSDLRYIGIALILAAITAVEIGLYYLEDQLGQLVAPSLIFLSMSKFMIVVFFFMHMKYEKPIIKRVFFVCFIGSIIVFSLYLMTFGGLYGLRPHEYDR